MTRYVENTPVGRYGAGNSTPTGNLGGGGQTFSMIGEAGVDTPTLIDSFELPAGSWMMHAGASADAWGLFLTLEVEGYFTNGALIASRPDDDNNIIQGQLIPMATTVLGTTTVNVYAAVMGVETPAQVSVVIDVTSR